MRFILSSAITLGLGLFLTVGTASADITFDLSNVQLETGATPSGTLTGSFTTNDAMTSVTSYDITASASGSYLGFTYTVANSSVTAQNLPSFFQVDTPGAPATVDELRLIFDGGLTASGGTLTAASYESEPSGGNRTVQSGSATLAPTGVPEPASFALIAAGLISSAAALLSRP